MRQQVGNNAGVAAVGLKNINGGADEMTAYTDTDLANVTAMRTRLAAIDAVTYTSVYLDKMTFNDMVFAIRRNDSPSTF